LPELRSGALCTGEVVVDADGDHGGLPPAPTHGASEVLSTANAAPEDLRLHAGERVVRDRRDLEAGTVGFALNGREANQRCDRALAVVRGERAPNTLLQERMV
jgi:hypothetical protein